jgi:hypothetical protein
MLNERFVQHVYLLTPSTIAGARIMILHVLFKGDHVTDSNHLIEEE